MSEIFLDKDIDLKIIQQKKIPNPNLSYFRTVEMLFSEGLNLLKDFISAPLPIGKIKVSQHNLESHYHKKPSISDGKKFRKEIGKFY